MTTDKTCQLYLPPERIEKSPDKIRWGIVSTVKAPTVQIARFVAWHLALGVDRIDLYLDDPDPMLQSFLNTHPKLNAIACDAAYWKNKPEKAQSSHQLRQAFNASRSYRHTKLHWLAHLDADEFLLPDRDVTQILADVPADCAGLEVRPVEMLFSDGPTQFFKRTPYAAGHGKEVLHQLYPEFADFLKHGFISYYTQKIIARTGMSPLRLGIHKMSSEGARVTNVKVADQMVLGHAHAPSYDHFLSHLPYRLTHGSYRESPKRNNKLNMVLGYLHKEEKEDGLRRLYNEVCTARPALVAGLRAHGMLVEREMQFDQIVQDQLGSLPEELA